MTDRKTAVEAQFDGMIGDKPPIDYNFDLATMGRKDRRIAKRLLAEDLAGKRCLDIGPGTGRWLTFMKRNSASYLAGIDISSEVLSRCAALCDRTQKADLEIDRFDFESDFFHVVLSIEVLEHIREPETYLSEILRVARDGGLVLMSIPNIVSLISRVRLLVGLLPPVIASDRTHVAFYRKQDLRRLLAPYGLTPTFLPTSISLNPMNPKSRFRLPSTSWLSSLDDSLLFAMRVRK